MDLFEFEKCIKNDYKVFVDTSSLMNVNAEFVFFKLIAPILYKYKAKLIISKSVVKELHRLFNLNKNIRKALHILEQLAKFELWGKNSQFDEDFFDNAIISQFTSLRLKYNLCLITNDKNLSKDILNLKISNSTSNIKDIKLYYI